MSNFRAVDRGTAYLLPPSVDEWLPSDHLARFVVEIVEQLDFSALTLQYRALHLSNAGIQEPNHGVNAQMFYAGLTWFF